MNPEYSKFFHTYDQEVGIGWIPWESLTSRIITLLWIPAYNFVQFFTLNILVKNFFSKTINFCRKSTFLIKIGHFERDLDFPGPRDYAQSKEHGRLHIKTLNWWGGKRWGNWKIDFYDTNIPTYFRKSIVNARYNSYWTLKLFIWVVWGYLHILQ